MAAVPPPDQGRRSGRPGRRRGDRARGQRIPWPGIHGPALLVADPDAVVTEVLESRLAAEGIDMIVCRDGARALIDIGHREPSTILLATRLPVLRACSVVAAVRSFCTITGRKTIGPGGARR